jgi:hypothetical protein
MDQWEYLPTYIEASAKKKEIREFLKNRFPDLKKPMRFAPESMMPELDALGRDGWELVHMEPVADVGKKGDVLFDGGRNWSNVFFCVFKRRRSVQIVMPVNAAGQPAFPAQQTPQPQPTPPAPQPMQPPQQPVQQESGSVEAVK